MAEIDLPAILLVDKPEGPTSHDVIRIARRHLDTRRIGHTGTLDPFASGLLLLCLGAATRLVEYFHLLPKTYTATAALGAETDSEDRTGAVTRRSEAWRVVTEGEIEQAAAGLRGPSAQVPPSYSALKVDGRRAYEVARAGGDVALEPRAVEVHRFEVTGIRLPEVDLLTEVSTGTYVRSLARDFGRALGCGAHLKALRRESIGPFRVNDAVDLLDLEAGEIPECAVISPVDALSWLPVRTLTPSETAEIEHGRRIRDPHGPDGSDLPVALVAGERLVAVARREASELQPEKVFHV
jgi:tRNA pseudouridine55 synthase